MPIWASSIGPSRHALLAGGLLGHGTSGEIVAASSRLGPIELDLFGGGIRERFLKTNKKSRPAENDREAADAGARDSPTRESRLDLPGRRDERIHCGRIRPGRPRPGRRRLRKRWSREKLAETKGDSGESDTNNEGNDHTGRRITLGRRARERIKEGRDPGRRGVSPQRVYSSVCASECRAVVWGVQCGVH